MPAPGLFSITNCWPRIWLMRCPSTRAVMSADDPGMKPTMMRTGRARVILGVRTGRNKSQRRAPMRARCSSPCSIHLLSSRCVRSHRSVRRVCYFLRPAASATVAQASSRWRDSGQVLGAAADEVDPLRRKRLGNLVACKASLAARASLSTISWACPRARAGRTTVRSRSRAIRLRPWSGGRARSWCACFGRRERNELAVAHVLQHGRGWRRRPECGRRAGRSPPADCRRRARAPIFTPASTLNSSARMRARSRPRRRRTTTGRACSSPDRSVP